jgi:hypothetical protein
MATMATATSASLGAALSDPRDPAARLAYVVRGRALELLARAISGEGLTALLVKGSALALTHYRPAWQRPMSDIDLLVRPAERDRLLRGLTAAGFEMEVNPRRPFSAAALGETCLSAPRECLGAAVEVHTRLDKVVGRPVDYEGILARAMPAPDLEGLLVPSVEDHTLLVVLHLGVADFEHPIGFVDLDRLLQTPADPAILVSRGRSWRLQTVLFVALSTLRALGARSVPPGLLDALEPGPLRRAAVGRFFDIGAYPPLRVPSGLGWPWILRQTALRDDPAGWALGVAGYAALRLADGVSGVVSK